MKSSYCPPDVSDELHDWLDKSASGYSLVIAATCGCDISTLGKTVCDHLNLADFQADRHFMAFSPDDIRHLAGVPDCREAVVTAAADMGIMVDYGCDYDSVLHSIAAMGDAVLSGEWALESLSEMQHVFRVVLSHCDQCFTDSSLMIDPQSYSDGGLAKIIAKRFKHWVEDQSNVVKSILSGASHCRCCYDVRKCRTKQEGITGLRGVLSSGRRFRSRERAGRLPGRLRWAW